MGNLHGRMPTKGESYAEHDTVEYRQRVATYVDGTTVGYEDTQFDAGESPAVLDVLSDLGRLGHEGQIINDGPGKITVAISASGSIYGGSHTLMAGEVMDFTNLKIERIKLTFIDDTGYRVMVA